MIKKGENEKKGIYINGLKWEILCILYDDAGRDRSDRKREDRNKNKNN